MKVGDFLDLFENIDKNLEIRFKCNLHQMVFSEMVVVEKYLRLDEELVAEEHIGIDENCNLYLVEGYKKPTRIDTIQDLLDIFKDVNKDLELKFKYSYVQQVNFGQWDDFLTDLKIDEDKKFLYLRKRCTIHLIEENLI